MHERGEGVWGGEIRKIGEELAGIDDLSATIMQIRQTCALVLKTVVILACGV